MKYLCAVNSRSGAGLGGKVLRALEEMFLAGSYQGKVLDLIDVGDAKLRELASNYDVLVVAGGDGTVSERLPLLLEVQKPMMVIPLGTGNDFAKEFGLPVCKNLDFITEFLELAKTLPTKQVDVWKLSSEHGSRLFCCYASFGYDARVVSSFEKIRSSGYIPKWTGRIGNRIAYALAGLARTFDKRHFSAFVWNSEQAPEKVSSQYTSFILANIKSIMGLGKSNKNGNAGDGSFEIVLVKHPFEFLGMLAHCRIPWLTPKVLKTCNEVELLGVDPKAGLQVDGEVIEGLISEKMTVRYLGQIKVLCDETFL